MKRFPARRALFGILAAALLAAVAASCLPDNPYQRFQQLDGTEYRNLRWIYERLHFDRAPVDVAFLGASRTASGVDATQVAAALARQGDPANVVNFAIPLNGRNLDWVLARQLFATKTPRLIVIGVIEQPGRYGHAVYKYVASRGEAIRPGYPTNPSYPRDILYLPFRQLKLAAARAFPAQFGLDPAFVRRPLAAEPGYRRDPDGHWRQIYPQRSRAVLDSGVARSRRITTKPVLSTRFAGLEFGQERHYLAEITAIARAHGARVAFLFIPQYGSNGHIQEADFYRSHGTLLDAGFLAADPANYSSYAHLNDAGTARLTAWLAPALARLLAPEPAPAAR